MALSFPSAEIKGTCHQDWQKDLLLICVYANMCVATHGDQRRVIDLLELKKPVSQSMWMLFLNGSAFKKIIKAMYLLFLYTFELVE